MCFRSRPTRPVGRAAATHLVSRGIAPLVLERGRQAGATKAEWAHVPVFSAWEYNVDPEARWLLVQAGWTMPGPNHRRRGDELIRHYFTPLAAHRSADRPQVLGADHGNGSASS